MCGTDNSPPVRLCRRHPPLPHGGTVPLVRGRLSVIPNEFGLLLTRTPCPPAAAGRLGPAPGAGGPVTRRPPVTGPTGRRDPSTTTASPARRRPVPTARRPR